MKSSGVNTLPTCKYASTFGGIALSSVTSVALSDAVRTSNVVMKESCRKTVEGVWYNGSKYVVCMGYDNVQAEKQTS